MCNEKEVCCKNCDECTELHCLGCSDSGHCGKVKIGRTLSITGEAIKFNHPDAYYDLVQVEEQIDIT